MKPAGIKIVSLLLQVYGINGILLPGGQLNPLLGMGAAVNIMMWVINKPGSDRQILHLRYVMGKQLRAVQYYRMVAKLPEVMLRIVLIPVTVIREQSHHPFLTLFVGILRDAFEDLLGSSVLEFPQNSGNVFFLGRGNDRYITGH